jgi:hypothetical protein
MAIETSSDDCHVIFAAAEIAEQNVTNENSAKSCGTKGGNNLYVDKIIGINGQITDVKKEKEKKEKEKKEKKEKKKEKENEKEKMNSDKMQVLWMPAQFGKTAEVQNMIRNNQKKKTGIDIMICSNNKLLVSQTGTRMTNALYPSEVSDLSDTDSETSSASDETSDDRIEEKVFKWMSGKTSNISVGELADRIKEDEVEFVVCCANKTRIRYLYQLVTNLNSSKKFKKEINIWIDEADATFNLWSKPEFNFSTFKRVKDITLVSATYSKVLDGFKKVRVIPLTPESTLRPSYLSLLDCNRVTFDGTIYSLLDTYPEISQPGARFFVPGGVKCDSHDVILDILVKRNFSVMILNGKRKMIVCPDGTIILICLQNNEDIDELSKLLPQLYERHNLAQWPFAVTGNLCLGRGITFQSEDFAFDFGLIPEINDADTAYQLTARMLGNIKQYPHFKVPTVFMTKNLETACLKKEKEALNIGNLVHEKGLLTVGHADLDYIHHQDEEKYELAKEGINTDVRFSQVFENYDLAKTWSKNVLSKTAAIMHLCDENGGEGDSHFHYRYCRQICSLEETKKSKDLSWGLSGNSGRIMPVLDGSAIGWMVVYKKHFVKTTVKQ